jgi:hypothetical protein
MYVGGLDLEWGIGHWGVMVEGGEGGCGGFGGEVGRAFAFHVGCCHFRGWTFVGRQSRVGRT